MKYYAGIGSRSTPKNILDLMTSIAIKLDGKGWTLRSGGAEGADTAFEIGAFQRREIYLPWPGFNHRTSQHSAPRLSEPQAEAFEIAAIHHPAWANLSKPVRCLHARNVHQILGPDVTAPVLSKFVICWTPDGAGGGGTGQALRISRYHDVPIFDLAIPADLERITKGL